MLFLPAMVYFCRLVKISRKYRSVIQACIHNLQESLDDSLDSEQLDLHNQVQIFSKIGLIWNLCEILYIDIQSAGSILIQLLDWIKWHFTSSDSKMADILDAEVAHLHESFWDVVYGYLLQGRTEEVRKLLRMNPQYKSPSFLSMDELLKKMPSYSMLGQEPIPDFEVKWRYWQNECIARLEQGEFITNNNLEKMCKILCGDKDTFEEMKDICETWYHMLVSMCLYTNPSIKPVDLSYLAQNCLQMYGCTENMSDLDKIILMALEFNVLDVIKECCQYSDNWWFVAHLTDLLDHNIGSLDLPQPRGVSLREFLLLEYASSLMSTQSLWQVGIGYLDHCKMFGRQTIELYLESISLESELKANKILHIAKRRNMHNIIQLVCKVMGLRAFQSDRIGSAMSWALHAKDAVFASFLADKFLLEYSKHGRFESLNMLDNLGPSMLVSDRLIFLGKYREFQKLYEESDFVGAADILVSLLTSQLAPKYFWITLLTDAAPLLELDDQIVFSSDQTYELLYCLEDALSIDTYNKANDDTRKQKVELIRIALARNLARALIHEGTKD